MIQVYAFEAAKQDVKGLKTRLEAVSLYHKQHGIRPAPDAEHSTMLVPTTIPVHTEEHDDFNDSNHDVLANFEYKIVHLTLTDPLPVSRDPLLQGLQCALATLPPEFWYTYMGKNTNTSLLISLRPSYQVCPPLLLLNATTAQHADFARLLHALSLPCNSSLKYTFFTTLVTSMRVTHVAVNAPVPFSTSAPTSTNPNQPQENILRSPTNLTSLHGNFGHPAPIPHPNSQHFIQALWATTIQNSIFQTWAPLHTMFSRGNIREKARLLALPSVQQAVANGKASGKGCSAVDLFVGIGYFAFSYKKAGVDCVLGWDLNPWSCEGLRRGAEGNGWSSRVFSEDTRDDTVLAVLRRADSAPGCETETDTQSYNTNKTLLPSFLTFNESNTHAPRRLAALRHAIAPVRHVNCGMLPSAGTQAWESAVRVLDPELGGWLHLHEVVGVGEVEVERKVGEILRLVRGFVGSLREGTGVGNGGNRVRVGAGEKGGGRGGGVEVLHVERVKSVGPKMVHIVVDLWVAPIGRECAGLD